MEYSKDKMVHQIFECVLHCAYFVEERSQDLFYGEQGRTQDLKVGGGALFLKVKYRCEQ